MTMDSEFERRARLTLEESVSRLDGATRSRLTQARFRAVEQLDQGAAPRVWWRRLSVRPTLLAPVGAMAAVVALTVILWVPKPNGGVGGDTANSMEDIELLADGDALAAMAEEDPEFYEWALAQDAAADQAVGS